MKKTLYIVIVIAILATMRFPAFAEDIFYVQSIKAKIMTQPSFKSPVLGEAAKGARLQSSGRQGSWVKVTVNQKEGYVSALLLSKLPPMERQSLIKGNEGDIKQSVRRRASTYTSAAAARGLAHDDRKRVSADEEVDYKAVEKMEAFKFTNDEVSRFVEGGKI